MVVFLSFSIIARRVGRCVRGRGSRKEVGKHERKPSLGVVSVVITYLDLN